MEKIKAKATLVENFQLIVDDTRGHSVVCDLPENGGKNTGPMPLELSLMSLAGCSVITYAGICKNSQIDHGKVEIEIEAEVPPNSQVISNVTMKVNIDSKEELSESAWRRAVANCPVLKIFNEKIPVNFDVAIKTE